MIKLTYRGKHIMTIHSKQNNKEVLDLVDLVVIDQNVEVRQ